jgi:drug/metabolite transporter (DMT)-like permease
VTVVVRGRGPVPATAWKVTVLRNAIRDGVPCPRARVVAVETLCWTLVAADFFDGFGLAVGGDEVATSPTYDVLRLVPGGMRTYGFALLLGSLCLAVALILARPSRNSARIVQAVLSFGVGYNLLWVICIPAAWWHSHELPAAWPAVSKYALLAAIYFYCARAVAPPPLRRR